MPRTEAIAQIDRALSEINSRISLINVNLIAARSNFRTRFGGEVISMTAEQQMNLVARINQASTDLVALAAAIPSANELLVADPPPEPEQPEPPR